MWSSPHACPSPARAGRHFPRWSPVARLGITSPALLVVPIKAIPVRTVTRASWWATTAASSAAADVLLSVDDVVGSAGTTGEVGSARLAEHSESLHKGAPHAIGCSRLPLHSEEHWDVLGTSTIPDVLNALRPLVHQHGAEVRLPHRCRWQMELAWPPVRFPVTDL